MIDRETVPSMSTSDEIHHSIADADDMEEVWDQRIMVADVFRNLVRHPFQLLTRLNWKAAMMGAVLRSSFYYAVYQASGENRLVILTAVAVEFVTRFISTGIAGAVVQSFRRSTPVWQANVIVSILLPAFSHTVEFVTHYGQERYLYDIFAASETTARSRAFAISVLFSVIAVLFNLFAMRHGVLLVGAGEETQSLGNDIKRLPRMVGEFTAYLPVQISKYFEEGRILNGLVIVIAFGVGVGTILGLFRFKWQWAWRSALGAWAILLFAVIITATARYISKRKGTMYRKRY
ncbi:MAG: hypothetical protein WKF34_02570 [Pyrinomonadaceae bacterium]